MTDFPDYPPELSSVRRVIPADPAPTQPDGKHAPGTILANFTEAVKTYGVPVGAFEHNRWHPYGTGH